jgi:hypothetical protein
MPMNLDGMQRTPAKRPRRRSAFALAGIVGLTGLASALATFTARATDSYTYKPNEYALIARGQAPDGKYSITTHGEGDGGYDHFHVYLMAEPGRHRIGPLEEIRDILDTAPLAYTALWSPDSRHVGVSYRSDRHVATLALYAIRNHRAYPLTGPLPSAAVTRGKATVPTAAVGVGDDHFKARDLEMKWLSPQRFSLREYEEFQESTPDLANAFGKFGRSERLEPSEAGDPPFYWIEFSAQAVCEIAPGDTYRIVSVRPAGFSGS